MEQSLCEYCMIFAAKSEQLELEVIQTIVSKWLLLFPDKDYSQSDSDLDLEVEKYVSLGGNTTHIYEIGYQLYLKVNKQ